jgi:probable F420-dependent oxidoreductase
MRTAIGVIGLESWFGGDFAVMAELVKIADQEGVDQISVVDHVVMGEATDKYPYGEFQGSPTYPWLEPVVQLATYAGVTKHIKLATGIIIAPLRPAAVLAKQLATLDVLSHGRIQIGLGVGWQKEEYDACGIPWEGRYDHMEEQVRVCRRLWSEAPLDFHGKYVNFDRIYQLPHPPQGADIPIYFGIIPNERNIARIADVGDGWLPMENDPKKLAEPIKRIKQAFAARGRNPDTLEVRTTIAVVKNANGKPDLDATLATMPVYAEAGVSTLRIPPPFFCRGLDDYTPFIKKMVRAARG